jgi:hypothetical protein
MTVLGTATKVYAGGTAAVAVYAGSVKVWPTAPPPPAAAWPVIPDSGLVLHVGATWAQLLEPGPPPIDLQLTQSFRDAAGFMGSSSPTWRPSDYGPPDYNELVVSIGENSASFSLLVASESASLITLESIPGGSVHRRLWAMVITP